MKLIRARIRNGRLTHPTERHEIDLARMEGRDVVLIALTPLQIEPTDRDAEVVHALLKFEKRHGEADTGA